HHRWRVDLRARLAQSLSGQVRASHTGRVPAVRSDSSALRPFSEIPGQWKNSVANLYTFWKIDGLRNIHRIMLHNFNMYGPIYREKVGYYESVNIIKPEDAAVLFNAEGHYPKRLRVEAWTSYRDYRNCKYGVLLKCRGTLCLCWMRSVRTLWLVSKKIERTGQNEWTTDLSHELFKYALESVSHVLYGERLGLLLDYIDPDAQHFIDCITLMFKTTSPMLYLPPALLRHTGARIWKDHVEAWDGIFNQADRCIQSIYRQLRKNPDAGEKYPGVLASLLMLDKLSIEDIKASITELMAGGMDTTSITLLWMLYELARHADLQEEIRAKISAARIASKGDVVQMLKMVPLLKGALKETLRLHPVAVSLQRYITEDIVLQNYHIPAGASVNLKGGAHEEEMRGHEHCSIRIQFKVSRSMHCIVRVCNRCIEKTSESLHPYYKCYNFNVKKNKKIHIFSTPHFQDEHYNC
uniref:Cholesterol side-chain cleavage enzyme, mitochondrial n=1 Tax=Sinocyclocheilus rhinocerous TaxID=307959 RepID=A0A673IEM1_9TELE